MNSGRENGQTGRGAPPGTAADQIRAFGRWWRRADAKRRAAILVPVGIIVLVILIWVVSRFATDYLWFQELGFTTVFWTNIWARVAVMVGAGVLFFAVFYGNLRIARLFVPRVRPVSVSDGAEGADGSDGEVYDLVDTRTKRGRRLLMVVSVALGVIFGIGYGGSWEQIWLFLKQTDFGFNAPVFLRDAAFFVFTLPVMRMALTFVMLCFLFAFLGSLGVYIAHGAIGLEGRSLRAARRVKAHLSIIVAVAMLGKAADYMLGVWGLAYSERGATFGPSYTDVHVQMPILRFLAIIALIAAVLFLVNIFFKGWRLPALAIAALFLTWLFAGQIYPAIIQQYRVSPTEIEKESPYIANNIASTRWAFGLNEVNLAPFEANTNLDAESIRDNAATIENVRVWDPSPALSTYRQIQEIRSYYTFLDVDVDRYVVDDMYRQVLLAAREFDSTKLSDQAQTWVNQHLTYTHGYGVTVSPVSEATEQGLPELFVRDIPPRGTTSLKITRPEIYFGEIADPFVLVKTTAKEFDYPMGDENVFTEYDGTGGVGIGGFARQFIFSVRFATIKLLVSDYLRPDSRIMYKRSLGERVSAIAPFLTYDGDPYMVIRDDGSLVWIWDAYTTIDSFPNSERNSVGINYIRNSVKVVVDAYNGDVTFYQIDPEDALAETWGKIYPGLLTPAEEMPEDIRRHLRYPEDLFGVQAETLSVYHMTEPQTFYNKEDVWEIATELYGGEERNVEPYYLMMVLPGETQEEYVLLQPFTPRTKQNMISWMAARMDGDAYGELVVIAFPKDKLVFGPAQVEARINNDPVISSQLTLWDQAGSDVIRGNLLVIPVEDSLIYVEPLYLQSEQSAIPELTRVIVAYGDAVVMENDLQSALDTIFSGGETTTTTAPSTTTTSPSTVTTTPGGTTTTLAPVTTTVPPVTTTTTIAGDLPTDRATLLDLAEQLYEEARAAQRADDWATYGLKIKRLGEVISALKALEGSTP